MLVLASPAITKYHRLGVLNNRNFLPVLEVRHSRWRFCLIQLLLKILFSICRHFLTMCAYGLPSVHAEMSDTEKEREKEERRERERRWALWGLFLSAQ